MGMEFPGGRKSALAIAAASEMLMSPAIAILVGSYLDKRYHTSPYILITLLVGALWHAKIALDRLLGLLKSMK